MSITSLKSYQNLINSNVQLFMQAHGDSGMFALGFRGPNSEIIKWHNFFCNFDTRPRNDWGAFPNPPRIKYLHDNLAFINISKTRIRSALMLYFETNIPLLKDVETKIVFNEEKEESVFERNEEEIIRLANEAADCFMVNEIKTHCFVPESGSAAMNEYSVSLNRREEKTSAIEKLADSVVNN